MKLGIRKNKGKPRLSLISPIALTRIAEVLTHGEKRYSAHNWRKGLKWSETLDSLLRHTNAFNSGQDFDKDSKLNHVAHIACNAIFLLEMYETHPELDDRYKYVETKRKIRSRISKKYSKKSSIRDKTPKKRNRKSQ